MHTKASRRSAFMTTIGFFMGFLTLYAGPATACETANCGHIVLAEDTAQEDTAQQAQTHAAAAPESVATTEIRITKKSRHARKSSRPGKSEKIASGSSKSADSKKTAERDTGKSGDARSDAKSSASSSVANANAQMLGTLKTSGESIKSIPEKTSFTDGGAATPKDGSTQSANTTSTSDQPDAHMELVASDQLNDLDRAASEEAPAPKILKVIAEPAYAASSSAASVDDSWNQASLIGKIFIAFGGVLTLASAARMLIG